MVDSTAGADFTPGAMQQTGRDLDVAVQGQGWIAVQAADGSEAYTRNGSLQVSANGMLQTRNGNAVLGDGGPIAIPPDTQRHDRAATARCRRCRPTTVPNAGRARSAASSWSIPPEGELVRGDDGLFRLRGGGAAPRPTPNVRAGRPARSKAATSTRSRRWSA